MQKYLIFLLAFFSLTIQAKADWNPYFMDHERFVHLNEKEKETLIIRTMEMMVELEAKYERQVIVSGYSSDRYQKYVQLLNKLQNFILSEAVAADFVGMQAKFTKLMGNENACIYGGWPSQTVKVNNSIYCVHPSLAPDKSVREAYQTGKGSCPGTGQITCNPMVFGFKQKADKNKKPVESLFCVKTGYTDPKTNKAHNVSYECMRASLQVENVPAGQDSKEVRISAMKADIDGNKDAFNSVHKYIFRTCACGEGGMNAAYKDYIRPHRTCFGMMNSLRAFGNDECEAMTSSFPKEDAEFIGKWNNFFTDENIKKLDVPLSKEPVDFDKKYRDLITHGNVIKYCDGDIPIKPDIPVIVPGEEVKPVWVCKAKCSTQKPKEGDETKAGEAPKIVCTIDQIGWSTIKDGKTEIKPIAEGELISKEITVTDAELKDLKASIGLKGDKKQVCELSAEPEVEAKTCTIAVVADGTDPKKVTATVAFQGLGDKVPEYTWTGGTENEEKPKEIIVDKAAEAKEVSVTFKVPGAEAVQGEKPLSCKGEVPKIGEEAKSNYGIDTYSDPLKPQDPSVKVHAKLSLDGKEIKEAPGHYISWTRTGAGAPKPKVVAKVKEKTTVASKDDVVKEEKDPKDKKKEKDDVDSVDPGDAKKEEDIAGEVGTRESSITETRIGVKYDVCASLIKKDTGKSVAGPSCQPIPPLAPGPSFNPNMNQNVPAPFFGVPERHAPAGGIL